MVSSWFQWLDWTTIAIRLFAGSVIPSGVEESRELPVHNATGCLDFARHDGHAEINSTISPFAGYDS